MPAWTLRWGLLLFAGIAAASLLMLPLAGSNQPFGGSTGVLALEISHDPEFAPYIADLYLLDVLTGQARPLFPLVDGHDYSQPSWSPDGRTLAYHYEDQGRWGLWLYTPASREARLLTHTTDPGHRPAWSPDGQSIVLLSSPRTITVLNVMDGTQYPVPDQGPETDRYKDPVWFANGDLAVWLSRGQQQAGFVLINLASGDVSMPNLTGLEDQTLEITWSNEPYQLAILSRQSSAIQLSLLDEGRWQTGNSFQLPASLIAYPSWSPDGHLLTLTELDADRPGYGRLHLLDLQHRLSLRLTGWVYAGWQNPSWQPAPSS